LIILIMIMMTIINDSGLSDVIICIIIITR